MRLLHKRDVEEIAAGSAILGTGGGGDPYLGRLAACRWIDMYGPLELTTLDELPDDMLVVCPFGIGSPVPMVEKLTVVKELVAAYRAMTRYFGREIGALMPAEIGGVNSVVPFAVGKELGLPVIDGDGMGRAYPEVHLVTMTLHGHAASPMAMADERGNVIIYDTIDNEWTERLARNSVVQFGAIAGGVAFPITVKDLKTAAIPGTVTYAQEIGAALRQAKADKSDAVAAVVKATGGFDLFKGKIIDIERRVEHGWSLGVCKIAGIGDLAGRTIEVDFQNENLVVREGDRYLAMVPDLIAILDSERGDAITTESLRYGLRVNVIGMPCHAQWRTPGGIELGGPRHFKYDVDYQTVEDLVAR